MACGSQTTLVHVGDDVNHYRFTGLHIFESDIEWRLSTVAHASGDDLAAVTEVIMLPPHGGVSPDFVSASCHHRIDSAVAKATV